MNPTAATDKTPIYVQVHTVEAIKHLLYFISLVTMETEQEMIRVFICEGPL